MLCDRKTVNVAKSQPGFISFIPLPLFTTLQNILPAISGVIKNIKSNKETWAAYVETEEDKKVYPEKKN